MISPVRYAGWSGSTKPGQREHHQWPDQPVQQQRGHQEAAVGGDVAELAVADLGQHRVHHQQQPDEDRRGYSAGDVRGVHHRGDAGRPAAESESETHRGENPDRQ